VRTRQRSSGRLPCSLGAMDGAVAAHLQKVKQAVRAWRGRGRLACLRIKTALRCMRRGVRQGRAFHTRHALRLLLRLLTPPGPAGRLELPGGRPTASSSGDLRLLRRLHQHLDFVVATDAAAGDLRAACRKYREIRARERDLGVLYAQMLRAPAAEALLTHQEAVNAAKRQQQAAAEELRACSRRAELRFEAV